MTAKRKVPATPPVKVEIRINGRIRFADVVYDPHFDQENEQVVFSVSRRPTLVDAPTVLRQPYGTDPRDGVDVIQQVHSGRRDGRNKP